MQIGIISDIHGDMRRLKMALDIFERLAVDTVVCAGDLVDSGPDGDAVVSFMRGSGIPCVQGNHDAEAHIAQALLDEAPELAFMIDHISPDNLAWLGALPQSLRFRWEGVDVLLAHANPHNLHDYITVYSSAETYAQAVAVAGADVLILGHTHRPMCVHYRDVMIVNPGSVLVNRTREARTCGVLSLPERDFRLYDIETGDVAPLEVTVIAG